MKTAVLILAIISIISMDGASQRYETNQLKDISVKDNPVRQTGYKGINELTLRFAVGEYGIDGVDLDLINGAQIGPYFFIGLGIGAHSSDNYDDWLPVFLDSRIFFLNKPFTPYLAIRSGYTFGAGLLFKIGTGIDIYLSERYSFCLGAGFGMQKDEYYHMQMHPFTEMVSKGSFCVNIGLSS